MPLYSEHVGVIGNATIKTWTCYVLVPPRAFAQVMYCSNATGLSDPMLCVPASDEKSPVGNVAGPAALAAYRYLGSCADWNRERGGDQRSVRVRPILPRQLVFSSCWCSGLLLRSILRKVSATSVGLTPRRVTISMVVSILSSCGMSGLSKPSLTHPLAYATGK